MTTLAQKLKRYTYAQLINYYKWLWVRWQNAEPDFDYEAECKATASEILRRVSQ